MTFSCWRHGMNASVSMFLCYLLTSVPVGCWCDVKFTYQIFYRLICSVLVCRRSDVISRSVYLFMSGLFGTVDLFQWPLDPAIMSSNWMATLATFGSRLVKLPGNELCMVIDYYVDICTYTYKNINVHLDTFRNYDSVPWSGQSIIREIEDWANVKLIVSFVHFIFSLCTSCDKLNITLGTSPTALVK